MSIILGALIGAGFFATVAGHITHHFITHARRTK